ncbi:TlpA disulfide reductase family protein [Anaerovibrio lipolyticus]|uniref:TlpA family protein disulfide reductase n=1 Tax=Anaerovibrio lipolyticus TaxID=82374 RepID=UPI0023F3B014|nr:TlpA disulfide reductase family protein [Anaerovibrio lipolyticus]
MQKFFKLTSMVVLVLAMLLLSAGCLAENATSSTQGAAKQNKFPNFKTVDLAGNVVTQEVFKKKKVTVVNIWGTFCPPCIGEMPELGDWARSMPADAQIIGIVCDVRDKNDKETIKEAERITANANAKFVNIVPDEGIMSYLDSVDAVPTTIFVDSEGNIIGESVIGADVARYKELLKRYLK